MVDVLLATPLDIAATLCSQTRWVDRLSPPDRKDPSHHKPGPPGIPTKCRCGKICPTVGAARAHCKLAVGRPRRTYGPNQAALKLMPEVFV